MESKTSSGDIGCLTVVGIVFVILKLLGVQPVCEWSWLWVLCPFWLPLAAFGYRDRVYGLRWTVRHADRNLYR